jgi:hypothetical protein
VCGSSLFSRRLSPAIPSIRFAVPSLIDVSFVTFLSLFALVTLVFEYMGWRTTMLAGLPSSFKAPYFISGVVSITGLMCLLGAMAATSFVGPHAS